MNDYVWRGSNGVMYKINDIGNEHLRNIVKGLISGRWNSQCFFSNPCCFEEIIKEAYIRRLETINNLYNCRKLWLNNILYYEELQYMAQKGIILEKRRYSFE